MGGDEYFSPASSTMDALCRGQRKAATTDTYDGDSFHLCGEVKCLSSDVALALMNDFHKIRDRNLGDSQVTTRRDAYDRTVYAHLSLSKDRIEHGCSGVELYLFHKYVMKTYKVQLAMHSAVSGVYDGIFIVATSDLRQSISRGGIQYVVHVTFDRGAVEAMLEVIEDGLVTYFPWAVTRKSDHVREALGSYDFADVPTLSDVDAVAGDMALADAVMREAEAEGGFVANCIYIIVCAGENHNCSKGGVDNISAFLKDIGISLPQLLQVGGGSAREGRLLPCHQRPEHKKSCPGGPSRQ